MKKRSVKILRIVAIAVPAIFFLGALLRGAHTRTRSFCQKTWSERHSKASFHGLMASETIIRSPYDQWLRDNGLFDGYVWVVSDTEERYLWGLTSSQRSRRYGSFAPVPINMSAFEKIRSSGKQAVLHRFHVLYSTGNRESQKEAILLLESAADALNKTQAAPATGKGGID